MMLTSLLVSGILVSGAKIISILCDAAEENKPATKKSISSTTYTSSNCKDNDYIQYDKEDEIKYDKEDEIDYSQETYDYLNKLTMDEIYEYVKYNDTLSYYDYKIYGTCNKDDKYLVLKHICDIAEKEGRSFTNKYSRY